MTSNDAEIDRQIARILQKLDAARDGGLECFGSSVQGFRLSRPLSELVVVSFEIEQGITLPPDYRAFLLKAGNGGAGPYAGIYPLSKWAEFASSHRSLTAQQLVVRPSILQPGHNEVRTRGGDTFAAMCQGTISIGSQGCDYGMQLIVAGQHRGRVVYLDESESIAPFVAYEPTFLDWYERWLDELLAGYDMDWFGLGPAGAESDFLAILDGVWPGPFRRVNALDALARLPALTIAGQARVIELLEDHDPAVRWEACKLVEKHNIRGGMQMAHMLLSDPVDSVRNAAASALLRLEPARFAHDVKALLQRETHPFTQSTILEKLMEADQMSADELMLIATSSPYIAVRRAALWRYKWRVQDAPHIESLLGDPDSMVRFEAARGAKELGLEVRPRPMRPAAMQRNHERPIRGRIWSAIADVRSMLKRVHRG